MPEETILVVDDEPANLQKLRRTFVNRYSVLSASSGGEALDLVQKNGDIAVIVADQRMPDMSGVDLLQRSLDLLPDAIRIILTGFIDADVLMEAINSCKVYRYIVKPWDPPDLLMTVERGLEAHRLAKENERFRKELIRRERLARELEIAREIQRYILPQRCPELDGYEMGVEYHPAREVGGDLYDFQWDHESETLHIVIGDVSGKSIPAALYGAVFSGQLQTLYSRKLKPTGALAILNNKLVARYQTANFIAVLYCCVDLKDGSCTCANGGMPFPLLVRGELISTLKIPGVPLGLIENTEYEELRFQIEPGDTLVLASDGATDARNRQGEFYDTARLMESICRHSAEEISLFLKKLHSNLIQFVGDAEFHDDVTLIGFRRRK
jgi:serine phosphatase RsbU (regulator of sigma subunit)